MIQEENEEKGKRKYVIIISVLLIAIIIVLLFCRFGRIVNPDLVPTGNVDVFDIDIYCNHRNKKVPITGDKDNEGYSKKGNDSNGAIDKNSKNGNSNGIINYDTDTNTNTTPDTTPDVIPDTDPDDDYEGILFDEEGRRLALYDKDRDQYTMGVSFINGQGGNFIFQERLNIFSNAAFNYTTKIAPGVSNVYHFVVHNSNSLDVTYKMETYEESEYPVNLKYRLKNNDNYIVGNDTTWVSASDLKTEMKRLNKGESDSYALEWKWFDDDSNDTIAGENMQSEYKLNMRFYIEAEGN